MSDTQKSCAGFFFLFAAMGLGVIAWVGGWAGMNFRAGTILGIGTFMFFFVLASYSFFKIENWSWLPAIAAGIYAVLPDILIGPEDDILALIVGALISAGLAWWQNRPKADKEE